MTHLTHGAVVEDDFHDVESDFDRRILEQAQVIERGSGEALAPLLVHRRRRARPLLRGTRLDFNEDEAVVVSEDEVDFAARGAKVCSEEFQAVAPEELFGRTLAKFAASQMLRLHLAGEPPLEFCKDIHLRRKQPVNHLLAIPERAHVTHLNGPGCWNQPHFVDPALPPSSRTPPRPLDRCIYLIS